MKAGDVTDTLELALQVPAQSMLDNAILTDISAKKWGRPA